MKKALCVTLLSLSVALATADAASLCGPQTDSFAVVIDASGSMMQTFGEAKEKAGIEDDAAINDEKIASAAKSFAAKIGTVIGQDKMQSSLYAVAPFARLVPLADRSGMEFKDETEAKFNADMEVFGRPSWVGKRADTFFKETLAGKNSLIFITDGGFTGELNDPVQALTEFRKANPDTLVYIVSAAYDDSSKAQVEAFNAESFMPILSLETLVTDDIAFNNFVTAAIYDKCSESIELKGVNFAFDKSDLDAKSLEILAQALEVVKARPETDRMRIEGWTDWVGSDAYNAGLSLRRAQVVRDYLVEHGIDAARIDIEGKGESYKYNNETPEGRFANRRAEIIFE